MAAINWESWTVYRHAKDPWVKSKRLKMIGFVHLKVVEQTCTSNIDQAHPDAPFLVMYDCLGSLKSINPITNKVFHKKRNLLVITNIVEIKSASLTKK